jgi:hypothetical protein
MAEVKNSFLKGKMNKDLDNRLLPNGEYRDALNISVGKSENQSVGSLQNVLGNAQLTKPTSTGTEPFESNTDLVCIGYFVDNENNRIYQFLTDYQDPNPSNINLPPAGREMKITVYDALNSGNPYITLVSGNFLNFSVTNLITGVNLVENLLFWTDNRNQPRKINISSAIANPATSPTPYYTTVDQISVAKYAPFTAPGMFTIIEGNVVSGAAVLEAGQTKLAILTSTITSSGLTMGDQLVGYGITVGDSAIVTNIIPAVFGYSWVYVSGNYTTLVPPIVGGESLTFYRCLMSKAPLQSIVNGNDNFLSDKFVRFSYRFKFDDNEYSLMAPFSQPVFIPEQKGYFINGDEDAAYKSTVLEWMQNDVNSVKLLIELPDTGSNIINSYKIESIDILYKESDALAVKVVETITASNIALNAPSTNIYSYVYESQKPRKTLQEAETVRVYDKVPVRALSQESAGNRIIYGNFINQSTPPATLDYNVVVIEKDLPFYSWLEYPNHTLKQNRTYQVGVVLSDKFGRQSSVILSSASPYTTGGNIVYGASSVFLPYKDSFWTTDVKDWLGDELALIFNKQITSSRDEVSGTPGLYATVSGSISGSSAGFQITAGAVVGNTYTLTLTGGAAQKNIPSIGNYLRGKYTDYVKVTNVQVSPIIIPPTPLPNPPSGSYVITTDGAISDFYNYNSANVPDIKYSYSINELGWYSYKIVVKQQEQEYYNVYVPGMLAGYPVNQSFATTPAPTQYSVFPVGEESTTCHFISINDNINKIPRDLSEVGPNQRQYRSSAQIWGRVENMLVNQGSISTGYASNRQYYPGSQPDVVSTIAPTQELNFLPNSTEENPHGSASFNIYQFETSPLVNRVTTANKIGVIGNYVGPNTANSPIIWNAMSPFLGVYETNPVSSALDIFWETSTSGYISELNADVLNGSDAIVSYSPLDFLYFENQDFQGGSNITGAANSPWITEWFYFKNESGVAVLSIDNMVFSAFNRSNQDITSSFQLVQDLAPLSPTYLYWRIKILSSEIYFGTNINTFGSFIFNFAITHTVGVGPSAVVYTPIVTTAGEILKVSNTVPAITNPSVDLTPVYNLTADPIIGPVIDMIGKNGNFGIYSGNYLADLYWKYDPLPSFDYSQWFSVNSSTGDVSLINTNILAGTFDLRVKLQDATTSAGLQTPGGLFAFREVRLSVPNVSVGCGTWSSIVYEDISTLTITGSTTQGYINIWKMLRKGETIASSDVWITSWKEYFTPYTYYNLPDRSWNVTFTPNSTTNFNGDFTNTWVAGSSGGLRPTVNPPEDITFKGTIVTSAGRTISILFTSTGVASTAPSGVYRQVFADTCVAGVPSGYVPTQCRNWYIVNNSSFPIPWSGLHGNGHEILGGILQPGEQVGTPANGGTQPIARYLSLTAGGTGAIGGIITYTGASVTCPL